MFKKLSVFKVMIFLIFAVATTLLIVETGFSQTPLVNIKGKKITQIGIVVKNAEESMVEYGKLFGIGPWRMIDMTATDVIMQDKFLGAPPFAVRGALANMGDLQFELLQPLYGPSTHMEFLKKHGQGIHHISFGRVDDPDDMLAGFKKAGFRIDMSGILGGAGVFIYMDTTADLGTVFEFGKAVPGAPPSTLLPYGSYTPAGPVAVNMKGKKIVQLGIVVDNVERVAKRYWEVFGIGPWRLMDMPPTEIVLHDRAIGNYPCVVRGAFANIGDLQIELLQAMTGPSTHVEFFGKQGNGIHHVSFGGVDDPDETLAAMKKAGYAVEMSGVLGGSSQFIYVSTQKKLGTIFEFVKRFPGKTSTLVPYGSYPPAK